MSTFVYARSATPTAPGDGNESGKKSPVEAFVTAVAALVPAEVLALHAAIISVTTEVVKDTTRISHLLTLRWSFFGLLAVSLGIYILVRLMTMKSEERWEWRDCLRMLIPPLAFLSWSMLQRTTAFDAVLLWEMCGGEPVKAATDRLKNFEAARTVIALFLAVVLGFAAVALKYKTPVKPLAPTLQNNQGVDVTIRVTAPTQS